MKIESHVKITADGENAVDALHRETDLPKQRIKHAMTQGAVWITQGRNTQRIRRAKRELSSGDELHLYYDDEILAEDPTPPKLVADVGGYSVWDKPPGLRSQGSKWGDHCTVVRWAEQHMTPQRSGFTVHRLDRAASGLILVAHSKKIAAALSSIFRSRKVEKRYVVTVHGDFSGHPDPLRVEATIEGKSAVSEVALLGVTRDRRYSQLEVRIETGRKHQIRRHLAQLDHPIVGDRLYGSGNEDGIDLQLRACLLAFRCPVSGEKVEYRASAEFTPAKR